MSLGSSVTAVLLGKSHLESCRVTKLKQFSEVHVEDYLPLFILQDLYSSSHTCSHIVLHWLNSIGLTFQRQTGTVVIGGTYARLLGRSAMSRMQF